MLATRVLCDSHFKGNCQLKMRIFHPTQIVKQTFYHFNCK